MTLNTRPSDGVVLRPWLMRTNAGFRADAALVGPRSIAPGRVIWRQGLTSVQSVRRHSGIRTRRWGGCAARARFVARRYHRARSGGDVRLPVRAQFAGAPEWRQAHGFLRRRGGSTSWHPRTLARFYSFTLVPPRRWRVREVLLDDAWQIGTRRISSAAKGDSVIIELGRVQPLNALLVAAEGWPTAELLLRRD